ncbi:MAG: ATP-binding cassette domain-containing protein [Pseudomonadota bacterium]
MPQWALKTENLNLHYGAFHGLKEVDFSVYQNHITALIGPSGCGKSTLLRCFNRMNELIDDVTLTGSVLVNGEPLTNSTLQG